MPGECWNCGQYLSGGDLLEGYCWNCKNEVNCKDGSYPGAETRTKTERNNE